MTLDPATCVEQGGHCWDSTGQVLMTMPPQHLEECRHCPATRVGVKQADMAYTYPDGQP